MRISVLLVWFILGLSLMACGAKNSKVAHNHSLVLNTVTRHTCKADPTQSYMVYLPTGFSESKKYPIIYVFDPHGSGLLAVNQFKEAAEQFGYIVVGSNNSKNGIANLEYIVNALVTDVLQQFPIEAGRQYAAGFSGGGRVAAYLAQRSGTIKGIITCGAGIPDLNTSANGSKFDIYAMAGRSDFNYQEVMQLSQQIAGSDWRVIVAPFSGIHHWPPVALLNEAVLWFQINAMRDGLVEKDMEVLNAEADSFLAASKKLFGQNCAFFALEKCKHGVSFFDGLVKTSDLKDLQNQIETSERYQAEQQKSAQFANIENQLRNGYLRAFTEKDWGWWSGEIKALLLKSKTSKDSFECQMIGRTKSFLGMACYSYTQQFLSENNQIQTQKLLDIYESLEPVNPDCFFFKAVLADRQLQTKRAVQLLDTALTLGFTDQAKMQKMISLQVLQLRDKK